MSDQGKYSEEQEKLRALAADFRNVFVSPEGQRVLRHILDVVLFGKAPLKRLVNPVTGMPCEMSANDALYLCARRDAAIAIQGILDYDPREFAKPVVRHTKP